MGRSLGGFEEMGNEVEVGRQYGSNEVKKCLVYFSILVIALAGCRSRRLQPLPTPPVILTCDDIVDRSLIDSTLWQAQGPAIAQWIRIHFKDADLSGVGDGPKVSDVIHCFGSALDASDAPLMFILWYPEKGLAIYQTGLGLTEAKADPTGILLTDVLLTMPGDERSMAMKMYLEPFAEKIRAKSHPWPERIEQLQFNIDR